MKEQLELRMYFFVPYQLTGIQQGIQCGHAALEYAAQYGDTSLFKEFVANHKTWIVLNGGTTNDNEDLDKRGSLNKISDVLYNNNIPFAQFREPDLQDAVTSVCFICDERVFNKEKYPDYNKKLLVSIENEPFPHLYKKLDNFEYIMSFSAWLKHIGDDKNLVLRKLLEGKRLA